MNVHEKYPDTGYVVICRDGPDGPSVRATAAKAHFAYMESVMNDLKLVGPLFNPAGEGLCLDRILSAFASHWALCRRQDLVIAC